MKMRATHYILMVVYIIYCIFYAINICKFDCIEMSIFGFVLIVVFFLLHCFIQHDFEDLFSNILIIFLLVFLFPHIVFVKLFYRYHGFSIIRSAVVINVEDKQNYKGGNTDIRFKYHKSYKTKTIYKLYKYKKGTKIFVIHPVECSNPVFKEYKDTTKYSQIYDFAFLDDTTFYTYHDFSLIKPDFVYYQEGFNVVYKATFDGNYLHFFDVCEKNRKVKYSINNGSITNVPDTFLVYRNVNEKINDRFIVCAPEINTPENWSKISDYGYIFHYDIYSKAEIETQCPQIKNYVEKFKERNKQ